MARGRPKRSVVDVATNVIQLETDAQIEAKLNERFEILDLLTEATINGDARSVIVSGPAGLGKSYSIEQGLNKWDPNETNHTICKGFVRATGLYKLFFSHKEKGQVIVFDDADSIFFDDVCLNLLKAVCDTTERRVVSWMAESRLVDDETGLLIPNRFEFNGTIIFITNIDFDAQIEKGHKLAPHLQAIMSRSHYIELAMRTRRDYLVRINQVIKQGLLNFLSAQEKKDVIAFIDENQDKLRELSLRIAIKIGQVRKMGGNWKGLARVTCCKH